MHCNNDDDDSACVDLRLFDVWNGYCVDFKPTARTFLLLHLCSNLAVLLAFDAVVWGRNVTLIMHVLSEYTAMALVILRWSSFVKRVAYWPWTNRPYVCMYCCVRVRLNSNASVVCNAVWGRNFTLIMAVMSTWYTTMAMTTLRWSLFVECMKLVPCWRLALNKQAVRLYYCACIRNVWLGMLEFDGVIGDWCSMRS